MKKISRYHPSILYEKDTKEEKKKERREQETQRIGKKKGVEFKRGGKKKYDRGVNPAEVRYATGG